MSKYKRLTSDTGFARNLPINEELYDRLYELENAIENGTLIELPCKVGDTVWKAKENDEGRLIYGVINSIDYKWIPDPKTENKAVLQTHFKALSPEVFHRVGMLDKAIFGFFFELAEIGVNVFKTEAEARAKLEELTHNGTEN